jgi:hypothetical protein
MGTRNVREIHALLWMCSLILLAHVALLFYAFGGIDFAVAHPKTHLTILLLLICWAICVIAVSAWFLILFAIHIKSTTLIQSEASIERVFAPDVKISRLGAGKTRIVAVPSLSGPGYQRGVLFLAGMSSLFVPDNFNDGGLLKEHLRYAAR